MAATKVPKVVFDCMVFVQAAGRRSGPARACFDLAVGGEIHWAGFIALVRSDQYATVADLYAIAAMLRPSGLRATPVK